MENKVNPGKLILWTERANWYFSKVSMLITMFGMLKLLGLTWIELVFLLVGFMILTVFIVYLDMKYVFPKFQEYSWQKNPIVKQLLEKK